MYGIKSQDEARHERLISTKEGWVMKARKRGCLELNFATSMCHPSRLTRYPVFSQCDMTAVFASSLIFAYLLVFVPSRPLSPMSSNIVFAK